MKKYKLFGIVLVIVTIIGMGLTGCELTEEFWYGGTLKIKNDSFTIPDIIIRVIIKQGNSSGDVMVDETVTIKGGEEKSYMLATGTYAVTVRTDLLFEENKTVNIYSGSTTTLIYDDSGLH